MSTSYSYYVKSDPYFDPVGGTMAVRYRCSDCDFELITVAADEITPENDAILRTHQQDHITFPGILTDPRVVERLKTGNWQFGHHGMHRGNGTKECPLYVHHHHDEFCNMPTREELLAADINPEDFRPQSRR